MTLNENNLNAMSDEELHTMVQDLMQKLASSRPSQESWERDRQMLKSVIAILEGRGYHFD